MLGLTQLTRLTGLTGRQGLTGVRGGGYGRVWFEQVFEYLVGRVARHEGYSGTCLVGPSTSDSRPGWEFCGTQRNGPVGR